MLRYRVNYYGIVADVRKKDLQENIAELSAMSPSKRKKMISSIMEGLDEALLAVQSGQWHRISKGLRQEITNHVGIWYANEVMEGRGDEALFTGKIDT